MNTDKFKPNTTYTLYIVAPPEKVWQALTDGEMTKQYFFGRRIESEWKVGAPVKYWQPDGTLDVSGTIVECDRPKRVSYTWCVEWVPELKKLPDCLVTFQIDDLKGASRLIMNEAHQWEIPDKLLEGGRRGWPFILCGLKTLLETGKPIPPVDMTYQQEAGKWMQEALAELRNSPPFKV